MHTKKKKEQKNSVVKRRDHEIRPLKYIQICPLLYVSTQIITKPKQKQVRDKNTSGGVIM